MRGTMSSEPTTLVRGFVLRTAHPEPSNNRPDIAENAGDLLPLVG